jgi:RimJ/RimL family protein N-acetyltransferase
MLSTADVRTKALSLWIDYLFRASGIHRISLDTWSFNPRMMRVAEKLGFTYEGGQRQLVAWRGERLDLVHYGLLRSERPARR